MKVCRLASRKNFVSECGNLEFNTHIYRKPVRESESLTGVGPALWSMQLRLPISVQIYKSRVWDIVPEGSILSFGDTLISRKHSV